MEFTWSACPNSTDNHRHSPRQFTASPLRLTLSFRDNDDGRDGVYTSSSFSSSRRKLKRKVSYRRLNRHSFSPPAATVALALSFSRSQRQLDWLNWTFVALSMHDMSAEGNKKKRRSWLIPTVCVVSIFQSMALQLCIEMEFWTSFQAPDDLQTSICECQCTHLEAATLPAYNIEYNVSNLKFTI